MGLIEKIKESAKKSGGSKKGFVYFKPDTKTRIRFLQEFDSGYDFNFHSSFADGIFCPCQAIFGEDCTNCGNNVPIREQYAWSVWDYDSSEVKIFMFASNAFTPVPQLLDYHDNYGTIMDRDYEIKVSGKQTSKTITVMPSDKVVFRNTTAKPFSKSAMIKVIKEAYPIDAKKDGSFDPKEYETENKAVVAEADYESMTDIALFRLCKLRGLEVEPRKTKRFYIVQLEEADQIDAGWE